MVHASTNPLDPYILKVGEPHREAGDWRLETGDRRFELETGDLSWRLELEAGDRRLEPLQN
jgi:subtilisin-like proprotein convertase family protein